MAGCSAITIPWGSTEDTPVPVGCEKFGPFYPSEATIDLLRQAQELHPEIRVDREWIVGHNRVYEEFC